jgi:hypothetical protein
VAKKDKALWTQKLIEARLTMTQFSDDKFFGYPDSEIQTVIDEAMKEDAASLRKKVQKASIACKTFSNDIDELDCLLKDTIELRNYPEDTRLDLNAIYNEIK